VGLNLGANGIFSKCKTSWEIIIDERTFFAPTDDQLEGIKLFSCQIIFIWISEFKTLLIIIFKLYSNLCQAGRVV
jgi:hypothetical protein